MTAHCNVDVLICGAGAAGLTLAIDLARRGVSFRLVEKMNHPFPGSRGKGVKPRTQEVFEDLGILDRVVAGGGLYPPERNHQADGGFVDSAISEPDDPTPAEPYHLALMSPQFLTERAMRERLAELGAAPDYGCELVGFEQTQTELAVRLRGARGEEILRVGYLVGADGGHSFVRRILKIGFPGETLGVRAVVADVTLEGLERDAWHHFNHGSMSVQVSLCPLRGTQMFQLQAPVPLEGDIDLTAEGLTRFIASRTGRNDLTIKAVSWASAFNMNARLADRYRVGRIFLIGDAAHIHPPTGGQGLNTSVQDAYNLGWKLAAVIDGAPDALLDTYEEERRPIAGDMLGLTTRLLEAVKLGEMRRGREVEQLDLGYPSSTIALEQPERVGALLAGDRAPDAVLTGAAGQPRRLFELFRGPHWTMLGYGVKSRPLAARPNLHVHRIDDDAELRDQAGHFKAAYEPAASEWFLIRPDGYIGAITREISALDDYFSTVGLRAPTWPPAPPKGAFSR